MGSPSIDSPSPAAQGAPLTSLRKGRLVLAAILLLALAIRGLLLPMPGLKDDIHAFTSWANIFRALPIGEFYAHDSPESDYLPGYLYILSATAGIRNLLVGAAAEPDRFALWIKLAPVAADLVLGLAVYLICSRLAGQRRALAATALTVLNPGLILVGSVWGQVDSVGAAVSMMALAALVTGYPVVAALLAGMAFVTKPQYCLFLIVAAVAYLRADILRLPPLSSPEGRATWLRWIGRRVALPVAVLAGTVEFLLLPFSVSIWTLADVEWTLFQRLAIATSKFPVTSTTAFNLWATPIAGQRLPDSTQAWLSLSYQAWGWLLLALVVALAVVVTWRRPNELPALLWACSIVALAFFVLLTRIHERYLFVAIPLMATGAIFNRWMIPIFVTVSGSYFLNVWAVYSAQPAGGDGLEGGLYGALVSPVSMINTLVLTLGLAGLVVLAAPGSKRLTLPTCRRADSLLWLSSAEQTQGSGISALSFLKPTRRRSAAVAILLSGLFLTATATGFLLGRTVGMESLRVRTATVRAYETWQGTGIQVAEGRQYLISARGDWTNKRGGERFGPGGSRRIDDGTIMPEVPIGVLLGRIGDAAPFVIGEGIELTATSSGPLQLIMNDWPIGRHDAQGSVSAKIILLEP